MTITDRIDRITHMTEEYSAKFLPAPKSVKIELTGRCNFNCFFCARSMRLREQQDMDFDMFKRLAMEMKEAGVEELGLFYLGESMLLKWLPDAIRYAKEECGYDYVFLTTNASLETKKKVRACLEAGLDSLKFSLNYADEDQFVEIAQVKKTIYKKMIQNMKNSQDIRDDVEEATGHRCGLYASYIQYDGSQGEKMKTVVDDLTPFLDEIYALPLYSQADFVGKAEEEKGWTVTAGNRGRLDNLTVPVPCWAAFTEGHITWDGHLSACCFDHDGKFHMGDLKEVSFMDAWNSQKFQDLRAAHLKKDLCGTVCEKCVVYN